MTELEILSKLNPRVRDDIDRYCRHRGIAYSAILRADRGNESQMARVDGLIRRLARRCHRLKQIHTAAGVTKSYALNVLTSDREKIETPIRTTDWGRMSICRR